MLCFELEFLHAISEFSWNTKTRWHWPCVVVHHLPPLWCVMLTCSLLEVYMPLDFFNHSIVIQKEWRWCFLVSFSLIIIIIIIIIILIVMHQTHTSYIILILIHHTSYSYSYITLILIHHTHTHTSHWTHVGGAQFYMRTLISPKKNFDMADYILEFALGL